MKMSFIAAVSAALLGLFVFSPAFSQQKTAKACQQEWRANKADNQAKGITEKAYIVECRASTNAAQPTAAPKTAAPPVKQESSTKPLAAPVAVAPAAKQQPATKPVAAAAPAPAGDNQFSTEAQAKGHCPSDTVVWANLNSKVYHFSGNKTYGNTKKGAYMCEKDTAAAGFRAAKNEKHS